MALATKPHISFAVAKDKQVCSTPLESLSLKDECSRFFAKKANFTFECGTSNYEIAKERRVNNAFIGTVYKAYCDHYNLEISAEDFWLAISQGVAKHINDDPEKHRSIFVSHEGKKKLEVEVDEIGIRPHSEGNLDKWPIAIQLMAKLVNADLKNDFVEILTNPFSSTAPVEKTVFNCTMMEALKNYYEYRFSLCCGIPQVTLMGKPEDFQSIIDRVNKLEAMIPDLKWWFDSMKPHLQKLLETSQGKIDTDWWSKICHSVGGGSDISMLAGWLADFVPYADNGKGKLRKARKDHNHYCQGLINGIDFSDFTEAIALTDFILDDNGNEIKMQLGSGFVGISQNPTTKALRPAIGWFTVYI